MKFFVSALLLFICNLAFAQKFGIDLGYAYTVNQMKLTHDPYPVYSEESFTKQYLFPNGSVRPYVRLHDRFFLYFGADFVKYEFSQYLHFNDAHKVDYKVHWILSEVQAPVMVRWQAIAFKEKHRLSVYGGLFARFVTKRTNRSFADNAQGGSSRDVLLKEKFQRYTNLVVGVHQTYAINSWLELYADLQVKYMPSYYYCRPNLFAMYLAVRCENKFAFSFTLGAGLFKSSYKKQAAATTSRLED